MHNKIGDSRAHNQCSISNHLVDKERQRMKREKNELNKNKNNPKTNSLSMLLPQAAIMSV